MAHNTIPIIGTGPVITDPNGVTDDTPDNAVVTVEVAAALTDLQPRSLKVMRGRREGPPSFVHRHQIRYRVGDLRKYMADIYTSTLIEAEH